MKRFCFLFVFVVSGCASIHSHVMPDADLKTYKTAYIEPMPKDVFNLSSATANQLAEIGFAVISDIPPSPAPAGSMLVKISYADGWDLGRYLKSYQVQLLDAQNKVLLATVSHHMEGNWISTEARIRQGFNALRTKMGMPLIATESSVPTESTLQKMEQ